MWGICLLTATQCHIYNGKAFAEWCILFHLTNKQLIEDLEKQQEVTNIGN